MRSLWNLAEYTVSNMNTKYNVLDLLLSEHFINVNFIIVSVFLRSQIERRH